MALWLLVLFVWGLVFGSFFNVLVYRLPRQISLFEPPSSCPICARRLTPLELLPLISFVLQRGRCRGCGRPISWQYPLVELATALGFVLVGLREGATPALLPGLVLVSVVVIASALDLTTRRIPNRFILAALAAALASLLVLPAASWPAALQGGLLVFVVMYLIALLARGGLGGGDVKLAAVEGLLLGPGAAIVMLLVAFVLGGVAGVLLLLSRKRRRHDTIPFAPFLAAGGIFAALYGNSIVHWYLFYTH